VLYFMQPSRSGWRIGDERWFAGTDEARRNAPSRGDAPGYVPQVMAMQIMGVTDTRYCVHRSIVYP
jgi:hypothetical protein